MRVRNFTDSKGPRAPALVNVVDVRSARRESSSQARSPNRRDFDRKIFRSQARLTTTMPATHNVASRLKTTFRPPSSNSILAITTGPPRQAVQAICSNVQIIVQTAKTLNVVRNQELTAQTSSKAMSSNSSAGDPEPPRYTTTLGLTDLVRTVQTETLPTICHPTHPLIGILSLPAPRSTTPWLALS